ncbi:hypothetical protein JCM11641_007367 [Rhodosporidiobolus odoratus]
MPPASSSRKGKKTRTAPYTAASATSSPPRSSPARAAQGELRLAEVSRQVYEESRAARNPNTERAYEQKQKAFLEWCDGLGLGVSARTVTGEKLVAYLRDVVINRAPQKRGPKSKKATSGKKGKGKQKAASPPPVSDSDEDGEDGDDGEDGATTGEGTAGVSAPIAKKVISGAVVEQTIYAIVDLWREQQALGMNTFENPGKHPAVRLIKEGYERSKHQRKRDAFTDRGIVILDNGKTNKDGRTEYAAFTRHEQAEVCGVGALGFYLFHRFQVSQESFPPDATKFPSFATSEDWFTLKLLFSGTNPFDPVLYKTFNASVHRANKATKLPTKAPSLTSSEGAGQGWRTKATKLPTKAVTHVFRGSGSRMADLGGAAKADIGQAGRWNVDAVDRCYLTGLAREVIRVHAGFDARGGMYFLRRDIEVPEELLRQVFPEADKWLCRVEEGDRALPTLSAINFLKLLIRLRPVIIQDAACIRATYPTHPIFLHPLFSSPAFLAFEQHMKQHLSTVQDPFALELERVLPLLTKHIDTGFDHQRQQLLQLVNIVSTLSEKVEKSGSSSHNLLSDVLNGRVAVRLHAETGGVNPEPSASTPAASTSAAASPSTSASSSLVTPALPLELNGALKTVDETWREWTEGVGGQKSVEEVYPEGSEELKKLRKVDRLRKQWDRKKAVVDKVRWIMKKKKVTGEVAVQALDTFRNQQKNKSLDALRKLLKADLSLDIPLPV